MSGLTGSIIELWDIDTSVYPYIDLKFNFGSGADRITSLLSTDTLWEPELEQVSTMLNLEGHGQRKEKSEKPSRIQLNLTQWMNHFLLLDLESI